jgi:MYXO-CTERM domain-containing protein
VQYLLPPDNGGGGADSTTTTSTGSGAGLNDAIDDPIEEGSCACTAVGNSNSSPIGAFALIALGAALSLRRRR